MREGNGQVRTRRTAGNRLQGSGPIRAGSALAGADSRRFPYDITAYYRMTTRRGLSLDVIDVAGHEVGTE
jgi:hypothetical protein